MCKPFEEMTLSELADYWWGQIVVAIGAGKGRSEMYNALDWSIRSYSRKISVRTDFFIRRIREIAENHESEEKLSQTLKEWDNRSGRFSEAKINEYMREHP